MGNYKVRDPQKLKGIYGRPPEYLFESDIREAMSQTKSNAQAAKYIGVSYPTYRKYALEYKDEDTGKTLFDIHKSTGKGIRRFYKRDYVNKVFKIIEGKAAYPKKYANKMLFIRDLIRTMIFEEKCDICGWSDKKPHDMTTPLLIEFKDGNQKNYLKDNLRLICPNCYSIYIGDVYHSQGFRKQYQGLKPKEPKKEVREEINYGSLDLDKPLTPEELANLDLSKL